MTKNRFLWVNCINVVELVFESDIRYFDFSGSSEPYKYQWQNKPRFRAVYCLEAPPLPGFDMRMRMMHGRDVKPF